MFLLALKPKNHLLYIVFSRYFTFFRLIILCFLCPSLRLLHPILFLRLLSLALLFQEQAAVFC